MIRREPAFISFASKKFVYFSAMTLSAPIMPLFLVREVKATDSQIGTITMTMTLVMLVGYFLWPWSSRKYGGRFVLLATTFGMIFYPALTAATPRFRSSSFMQALPDFSNQALTWSSLMS
ncbi:hypothetical protein [Candidatus Villigracilis saccharophilus]|uniref:hypothetical protein n=1 Tax=Candidatus Villigracilis saccharophilus TaxID=3140684 RepID=UPI0031371E12|nr:hypothetical protein [Anaerolineales bacterium]